jgi:hypothetical protein
MEAKLKFTISALVWAMMLLAAYSISAQTGASDKKQQTVDRKTAAVLAAGPNLQVLGGGTVGQLPKWTGLTSTNSFLGDSIITETKLGNIGIGTTTPGSKLTVAGTIETTSGGVRFPDGTLQTTAGLSSVLHDATLTGNGTATSPLGIANSGVGTSQLADNAVTTSKIADGAVVATKIAPATVVRSLNGLTDNVTLAAGSGITLTPVGNTLTIAAPAANPAQTAFQTSVELILDPNDFGTGSADITVPSGKRLVIEYLSIKVFRDGECQPMSVSTTVDGVASKHFIELPVDQNGFGFAIDKPVRIYADSNVHFAAISRSGSKDKNYDITVSGYLVDRP